MAYAILTWEVTVVDWLNDTQKAISFIEEHLLENISMEDVSEQVYASGDYFNKIFRIVTGVSVGEYIRNRRMTLAGEDLSASANKVLDIALKYGYETPESFSKAFSRFHGILPSEATLFTNRLKNFRPLTIHVDVRGGFNMSRKIISNVAKIYENPAENYMFPSCMRSLMGALNESSDLDFLFFAGVTGDLFTQTWREPKWQYNDTYSTVCRDSQIPIKAAFDACGYAYEYYDKDDIICTNQECIRKIVDSIDNGLPVLTFGIVGPPTCSVIYGYEENGDVLIGWSQFTDEPKADIPTDLVVSENYFSVRNGLERSEALIFMKKKETAPNLTDSVRASILKIPEMAGLPSTDSVFFGTQAFERWADSLLCDECFEHEGMLEGPLDTYGSCMVMAGTNMHFIQEYLSRALRCCPDMKDRLERLKQAYTEENEALQRLVEFQGGYFFDADRKALLNRDFRRALSELVRQVGHKFGEAARVAG
jgi:AraC-like DNA-binding protein